MGELEKDMKSYSQAGQDLWVLDNLNYKKKGFFLDIGAYDGVKFSNSYLLEKDYEWDGLLIEAHPNSVEKIIKIRSNKCLNYAISNENGKVYFESNEGTGSKVSNSGIEINSITLTSLFEIYNVPHIIDYMSLDIEGYEFKALEKFPFNTHKCLLLTVEHNLYCDGDKNKNKIKKILTENNYRIVKENVESEGKPFEDWYKYGNN